MGRRLVTLGLAIVTGVLVSIVPISRASAADTLTIIRSDGTTMDAFAVVPCPYCAPGILQLRHAAIASNGVGTVYSNDIVSGACGTTCSLISAGWISSSVNGYHTELHVRAYILTGTQDIVVEWIWGKGNVAG
jgi:hypothetical protein